MIVTKRLLIKFASFVAITLCVLCRKLISPSLKMQSYTKMSNYCSHASYSYMLDESR